MFDLLVTPLLRLLSRLAQGAFNGSLGHSLKVGRFRQSLGLKAAVPVVAFQSLRVSDDPSFHRLHHEVNGIFASEAQIPFVPVSQVASGCLVHRPLCVDQQDIHRIVPIVDSRLKALECLVAWAATDQLPMQLLFSGRVLERLKKCVHPLAKSGLG